MGGLIYASYGYRKNREAEVLLIENKEIANDEQITTNIQ